MQEKSELDSKQNDVDENLNRSMEIFLNDYHEGEKDKQLEELIHAHHDLINQNENLKL